MQSSLRLGRPAPGRDRVSGATATPQGRAGRTPSWHRRFDPFPVLVGIVALVTYSLHGFDGKLTRDLALYAYAGQQVADGVPPYLGALNRAGPLAHAIPAIGVVGARIVGIDELLGMRVLFMLIAVASVCAVYLLGHDLFDSRAAGLVSAFTFLSFYGYIYYASGGPREKTPMVLFLVASLLALQRRRWFTAGILTSLATLVLQLAFPIGLLAAVVMPAVLHRGRLRAYVRFALGGLLPLAVCVAYFTVVGALTQFVRDFALLNARYTSASPISKRFGHKVADLQDAYGITFWFMLVGLVVLLLLSLRALRRRNWLDEQKVALAAVGAGCAAGLGWSLRDFDSWPDAILVLPLAAIGIGALAKLLIDRVPARAGVAVALIWAVFTVGIAVQWSVGARDHRLDRQRASVAAKLGHLPDDVTMFNYNSPQPLVLTGRTSPTRFLIFSNGITQYIADSWPGGIKGFAHHVLGDHPTVITLPATNNPPWWMKPTLRQHYVRVGRVPGITWYVNRSVGHDKIRTLRRAGSPKYS